LASTLPTLASALPTLVSALPTLSTLAACKIHGSGKVRRKCVESIGDFRRQVAIAGSCAESDEGAH
jgi:hypothetical protein